LISKTPRLGRGVFVQEVPTADRGLKNSITSPSAGDFSTWEIDVEGLRMP
jgi:hypothetical protein